jgi:DnaJ-class molecular chaperone
VASSDDYYALLGIAVEADDEELRRAWRRLALEWHPDRAGPEATADFAACSSCNGERAVEDLYSAWLAVRPGVAEGTILTPSARMPGMLRPISFRVCRPDWLLG